MPQTLTGEVEGNLAPGRSLPQARRRLLARLTLTILRPSCQARIPVPTRTPHVDLIAPLSDDAKVALRARPQS
jgi:hypothetical protein